MGLVSTLFEGLRGGLQAAGDSPSEDSYFTSGPAFPSATGIFVTPSLAFQVSAVFRAVTILADISTLPLITYQELGDGGKKRLPDHPVGRRIRTKGMANAWQTGEQWRHTMVARAALWGLGLSEMQREPGGAFAGFEPLDNEHSQLEQLSNGRIRCQYTPPGESPRVIPQERLFRLQGPGCHEYLGAELLSLAREAVGLWIAMERFGGMYFARGARPGIAVKVKGKLSPDARTALRERFEQMASGWRNHWRPLLLENDSELQPFGFNAKDSQLNEARDSQVYDIARWFGVPARMLQVGKLQPSGSAEQDGRELVDYALRPWGVRFEAALQRDAFSEDDVFCEHLFEGLLRGNTKERFEAYALAIMNGIMAENEVRIRENLNPIEGLWEPRRSVNQDRGAEPRRGEARPRPPAREPEPEDDDEATRLARPPLAEPPRRFVLITEAAARRVVGREKAALRDRCAKLAGKGAAWSEWLTDFYGEQLPAVVAEALQLEPAVVRDYCERRRAAIETEGLHVADAAWEQSAIHELVELATKETAHAA